MSVLEFGGRRGENLNLINLNCPFLHRFPKEHKPVLGLELWLPLKPTCLSAAVTGKMQRLVPSCSVHAEF